MKRRISLGLMTFLFGMTAISDLTQSVSQNQGGNNGDQQRIVGTWRLAWLEEQGADGKVHRADCTGLLIFTRDGHMSVQVMYRNPQAATQGGPVQYAQGGYEASFGTYEANGNAHTFIYHVEGALVRTLLGKDRTRVYEFSGKRLIVKSPDPNERWRVAWEHY